MLELAEAMYETRTLGVRIVDDALVEAVSAGRTQIVLIGAGLDTHAFRLTWPQPVHLFEIDLPPLFAFKEPILQGVGATASCERHVIAADLVRGDWPDMLVANGFQPDVPTHWVDHALMTLPTATARAGVAALSDLSASGSQYTFPVLERQRYAKTLRSVRGADALYRGTPTVARGLGEDAQEWIESLGWTTTFRTLTELTAGYSRAVGADAGSGNIIATRC
jgi:methyltransferase (TIGR00027 family)